MRVKKEHCSVYKGVGREVGGVGEPISPLYSLILDEGDLTTISA